MQYFLLPLLTTLAFLSCGNGDGGIAEAEYSATDAVTAPVAEDDSVAIHPVYHGSLVLQSDEHTIYVDPHGGAERYSGFPAPDLVLITHTHGDHLDPETLGGLDLSGADLIGPQAVIDAIDEGQFAAVHVLANGESREWENARIEAVPAYNPPPKENFHPEGKFNGYVLNISDERIYVSGDTEGVPAMRELENIDVAFVAMNLPYTMGIDQAAESVLAFAPGVVYPYHYRNQDETFSDREAFRDRVVRENDGIEVRLEDWYD